MGMSVVLKYNKRFVCFILVCRFIGPYLGQLLVHISVAILIEYWWLVDLESDKS